jgi:endonuclease/exonuclease/phosphatase family metal-dependent hydrolase
MKLKVISFNIRNCDDKNGHSIMERAPRLKTVLDGVDADVIGLQECKSDWEKILDNDYGDKYEIFLVHRGDDESIPILWKKDKFDCVKKGVFWLSDTPRVPGSRYGTDQSKYPRICTAAVLITREERKILRVYNTHLDHVGPVARAQGISAVLSRIEEDESVYPNTPVVLTGDLNDTPDALAIQSITAFRDGMLRDIAADVGPTLHLYHPENTEKYIKIDYIFTNAHRGEMEATCLTDVENGVYFSDHYPVLGEIEI